MAITPLANSFQGFVSDVSREQIPKGLCYRMKDYIPQNGAPARKRGGWEYASAAMTGDYISGLGWYHSVGSADDHLLVVDNDGQVYALRSFDGTSTGTFISNLGSALTHKMVYFGGSLVLFDPSGGSFTYSGSSSLSSGVSNYKTGASWGEFLVFGNHASFANRIAWASSTSSLITGSTWDLPGEVVGVAGLPNVVIVFGYTDTWALFGDNPPPGGNLQERVLYSANGCMDERSIQATSSFVIWANTSGIYMTSGGEPEPLDLTKAGGIKLFWRDLVRDFSLTDGWSAVAGLGRGYYWITVHNGDTEVATLLCDLDQQKWIEFTNVGASAYAQRPGGSGTTTAVGADELFFSRRSEPRVGSLFSCWDQGAEDADGTPILPVIETAYYALSQGQSRARRAFLTYDLEAPDLTTPKIQLGFVDTPDSTDYTDSRKLLLPTTGRDRDDADVRRRVRGIAFRISQTLASNDTKLYQIDLEAHPLSGSR